MTRITTLILAAVGLASTAFASSSSYDVYAKENSSSGGSGVATIYLNAGQQFSTSASPKDIWNAGSLPRWANADGLVQSLWSTGSDESGTPSGTQIGALFPSWTQHSLTAPYGSLVGEIGGNFFLLGASYSGIAGFSGVLNLWYWDENNGDNQDYITVRVSTPSKPHGVPDNGGILLAVMGFGALVGFRRFVRR